MTKYYLRIEGINLDNFVYDTQDLSTIRGSGLAILNAVNLLDKKEFALNATTSLILEKISSGASAGLFEFNIDPKITRPTSFEPLCTNVRDFLSDENPVLKFATFAIDILPSAERPETAFKQDREMILTKNRWRQMQSPRFAFPGVEQPTPDSPNRVSCEVDQVTPARRKKKFKGGVKEIGDSVYCRRKYGHDKKQQFVREELAGYLNPSAIEYNFAWDFDDLTFGKKDASGLDKGKDNLHHKMAVIYIDGNDFGNRQRNLAIDELKKFDEVKVDYQRRWLASLMRDVTDDENKNDWQVTLENEKGELETVYQLELLLWGGDEVCMVVPAWKGWNVIQGFYEETKDLMFDNRLLTHSAGIVFCHHNAPIRRIKDLAKELAEWVKARPKKDNLFAYEILESFDHIGKHIAEYRKSRSPQTEPVGEASLILNGNNTAEIRNKMNDLRLFVPRRKLTQIVQTLLSPLTDDDERVRRREIIDGIIRTIRRSIGDIDSGKLDDFVDLFETEAVTWIHANALWDYIEEANTRC